MTVTGEPFFRALYGGIQAAQNMEAITVSEGVSQDAAGAAAEYFPRFVD